MLWTAENDNFTRQEPHSNEGVRQELKHSSLLCKERSRSWEVQHFWAPKPQNEPPEDQLLGPSGWPGASVNLLCGLNPERPRMSSPMLLGHPEGPSNKQPDLGRPFPYVKMTFLKNLCWRCGATLLFGRGEDGGGEQ